MKKIILSFLFTIVALFGMTGCESDSVQNATNGNGYNNSSNDNKESDVKITEPANSSKTHKLGETFTFDDLELTLDTTYSFVTLKNRYSEHNGKSVIKLGVTVKNLASEKNHLNMYYFDLFGSQGTELDGVAAYFDNTIDYAGDLKPGASYKTYFYILYDGDGKYSIDFDNYSEETSVEFDIKK